MNKILLSVFSAILAIFIMASPAYALNKEAGSSAYLKITVKNETKFDYRVYILRKFLAKNNSPLTPYSLNFIKTADYYDLDWRMVPAISGVESTFGKAIPTNSYNAYGWVNGNFYFKSWPDSINVVSQTLRNNYINNGIISISDISHVYAPPSKTWGGNVSYFISKISPLPLSFDI